MPRVTRSLQPLLWRDGHLPMTGTIKSLSIIPIADNLYVCGSGWGTGRWKRIETLDMNLVNVWFRGGTGGLYTWDGATRWFSLYSYDTAYRACIKLINGAAEIPRLGDVTVLASKVLNFGSNPILYTPLKHICPFDLIGGATNIYIQTFPSGEFTQDLHVDKVIVSIDQPAGAGKTVTVEVSDGTNTMTVTITGDTDVVGSTTTNNFDLDVSAESLTLHYSQTAGGAAVAGTIICVHHYITNV